MAIDFATLPVTLRPSPDAGAFWDGIARGSLVLPRCTSCGQLFFYPRTSCPECGSRDLAHEMTAGYGRVHAFAIHHVPPPGYDKSHVPFVTALIELDEGPRLMALLDIEPALTDLVDLAVRVAFTVDAAGRPAYYFRPAE